MSMDVRIVAIPDGYDFVRWKAKMTALESNTTIKILIT